MGRPHNCNCECGCCPAAPIVLDTWIGGRAGIPTDLTQFPAWFEHGLNTKNNAGLLWAVCCVGTGTLAAETPFCIEQNFEFFGCLPETPMSFGIAKIPACSGDPLAVDLMPLAIGTLFEGQIRERNDDDIFSASRRHLRLRERLGSECVEFGFPDDHGAVICESQVLTNSECPWGLDLVEDGDLEYSLVVLCVCCSESLTGLWWDWREYPHTYQPTTHDSIHRDARCCVEGASELRPASCVPEIVLLDGGLRDSGTNPNESDYFDSPNLDVETLRGLYGSAVSFWGSWPLTTPAAGSEPYDLTRAKMIWLGAFSAIETSQNPNYTDQHSFASGDLDYLKNWLALGHKLLVLDWGRMNDSVLDALGIECAVEEASNPNTFPSLNWRRSPYAVAHFCGAGPTIAPQAHLLTTGITESLIAIRTSSAGGFTVAKTFVPVITPSADGVVLGRCQGDLFLASDCESVDYPAIVLEPYPDNPTSHVLVAPVTSFFLGTGINGDPSEFYADGLSRAGNLDFLKNLQTFLDAL